MNNSWRQWPTGFAMTPDGLFTPTSCLDIIFNSVMWVRFPTMILAAFITTSFCVAATGAWHLLRGNFHSKAA